VLAVPTQQRGKTGNVYQVNVDTGKMQLVRTFAETWQRNGEHGGSYMSGDGGAYAYRYMQVLSQVYVVKG